MSTAATTPAPTRIDRAPADLCHLRRDEDRVAACGAPAPARHGGLRFEVGMTRCPIHELPVCPACVRIAAGWLRSDVWEGA